MFVIGAIVCPQLTGCSSVGELQPLTEHDIVILQTKTNEILPPIREASGCKLSIWSLNRGSMQDTAQIEYSIWLVKEGEECDAVLSDLNTLGRPDGILFEMIEIVEFGLERMEPDKKRNFDLIHEVNPEDGT